MQTTHEDLARYVQYKKLQEEGPVMEVYITDPTQEPDTSKWITEIYYPIVKK
jgi:effector-binding domain-containing protein